MGEIKNLTPEEFRRMQLLQLDMISELDKVCRKNDIKYTLFGGSLLGAVRHKGYIPWDDDADIAMLREDYEKFKKVTNQLDPEICFFQDHTTDPEFRWGYAKLRRTGTVYIRAGQEHIKCKNGFFIDIFPMDDIPKSTIGQMLQDFHCFCLRKILWSEVGKLNDKSAFMRGWYKLLSHISPEKVFAKVNKITAKSRNDSENKVRTLLFPAIGKLYIKNPIKQRYGMPKRWFTDLCEYDFEGRKFMGTKDYDEFLKYVYDDYMTLPPEDQRDPHAPVSEYKF